MNRSARFCILLAGLLFLFPARDIPGQPSERSDGEPDEIVFCVLKYGGGGDWYNGLAGVRNFIIAFRQITGLSIAPREKVVTLLDDELFQYPFLYLNGHGNISLTDAEVRRLRLYLENGGFLFCNDDYGLDSSLRRELAKVFPDNPLVEVPFSHPLYRCWFQFPSGPPKVHEHDGGPARGFGIFLNGRLALYYASEADIADGWEEEWVHNDPASIREQAVHLGVNILICSLTQ
jgi:hypothetical protein